MLLINSISACIASLPAPIRTTPAVVEVPVDKLRTVPASKVVEVSEVYVLCEVEVMCTEVVSAVSVLLVN